MPQTQVPLRNGLGFRLPWRTSTAWTATGTTPLSVGLKTGRAVIAQTMKQQRLLEQHFGLSASIVPNCYVEPLRSPIHEAGRAAGGSDRVLWVGRLSSEKRFEWLLDVAEKCPHILFDVVGTANTASKYVRALNARAAGMTNIKMHGGVPYTAMAEFYQQATVLCCTSRV